MSRFPKKAGIFMEWEPRFAALGFVAIPTKGKAPAIKAWEKAGTLSDQERQANRNRFADCNIGVLAGTKLRTGATFGFVDVDHPALVAFVAEVLGNVTAGKVGSKGATYFCQALVDKSRKFFPKMLTKPAVEIFVSSGQTVCPPSIHPSGPQYRWSPQSLLDVEHEQLPVLDETKLKIMEFVIQNKHAWEIIDGGPGGKFHAPMLSLTSSGIANVTSDLEWLASCLNALLPNGYEGNTNEETLGMLQSAKRKGMGQLKSRDYDPGETGPVPLGYTRDSLYAFRDQRRNLIILASASQLLAQQYLVGLAPTIFWASQFAAEKRAFDSWAAGEALINSCLDRGAFNPISVRGRGIWREGDLIVKNLGAPLPANVKYLYLCFEPIEFPDSQSFETERLHQLLQMFPWRNSYDATLALGWLALAPICGVVEWRPHCFLYGPPQSGKTTIHTLAAKLLQPLGISADGQSSEAGIRQTLGPDSLPILIDEFESDQHGSGLRGVLRLARSASSADNPVLRGTPEGKAMQFSLRTTFFFSAVNSGRMSPADQSRILLLELTKHEGERKIAQLIHEEAIHFRELGPRWCGYMISIAELLNNAINIFDRHLLSANQRHRKNFSTLLGAAFIALNRREPSDVEAGSWAESYLGALEQHAEDVDRDNSLECLQHLLAYVVEGYPLGHWIAVSLLNDEQHQHYYSAEKIMRTYEIIAKPSNDHGGVLIRNGSPAIETVFRGTVWEARAWQRALRAVDGAFSLKNPVHFSGASAKSRCTGVPIQYIPDPIEIQGPSEDSPYH